MVKRDGWSWRTNPKRFVVMVVLALVVGLAIPVAVGYVVDKAYGVGVNSNQDPCGSVTPKAKRVRVGTSCGRRPGL